MDALAPALRDHQRGQGRPSADGHDLLAALRRRFCRSSRARNSAGLAGRLYRDRRSLHVHRVRPQLRDGRRSQMDARGVRDGAGADLVLYLDIDVESLIPRVIMGKGMDYWESGMHLALGIDLFDSFERYQGRLIDEYRRLSGEFGFISVDARLPIEELQGELRKHIAEYLS